MFNRRPGYRKAPRDPGCEDALQKIDMKLLLQNALKKARIEGVFSHH